ncbi:MAG: hypothetical protein BWZ10_02741 [candidate division BRC1 bacterium ADurb.BinA364]|nr:MAG: hypothetical protein BWZ10_02741 [candidate division BRC1 bacterium ADurb.BinA364]
MGIRRPSCGSEGAARLRSGLRTKGGEERFLALERQPVQRTDGIGAERTAQPVAQQRERAIGGGDPGRAKGGAVAFATGKRGAVVAGAGEQFLPAQPLLRDVMIDKHRRIESGGVALAPQPPPELGVFAAPGVIV